MKIFILTILSLCYILPLSAQYATVTPNATPAATVPSDFMGWGQEWGPAQAIMGQASTGTDLIYRQMVTNLSQFGGKVFIRVGGNSTDNQTSVPNIQPMIELAGATNTEFTLGINLHSATLSQQEAQAAAYISGMPSGSLVASELGNEPNAYYQSPPYVYGPEYQAILTALYAGVRGTYPTANFEGPSCSTYIGNAFICDSSGFETEGFTNILASGAQNGLSVATWHYYVNAAGSCLTPFDCLIQPPAYVSTSWASQYTPSAHALKMKNRVNEINTLYGGGQTAVSNSFQSALWAIVISMNYAASGIDGVNFQGSYETTDGVYYDPFQITVTAGTPNTFALNVVNPIYYGEYFFDVATQHNAGIYNTTTSLGTPCTTTSWTPATACVQSWFTVDTSGNQRLVVVNLDEVNSGNVLITNSASTASVCYLTAPSYSSVPSSSMTFAGQTFYGSTSGSIQGSPSYTTLTPSGGGVFSIPIAVTQAAIVRFGVSTGC